MVRTLLISALLVSALNVLLGCAMQPDNTNITGTNASAPVPNSNSPQIILKLDDLKYDKNAVVGEGWQQVIDYLNAQGVVGTIGVIGKSLESDQQDYFDWIKQRHAEGHEIWHHGYCHCRWYDFGKRISEYQGNLIETQKHSLVTTQQLGKQKLGITFRTFGAPYNATDEHTTALLNQMSDIRVWLYKENHAPSDKFVLSRVRDVNIEYPVHQPDFAKFKAGYQQHLDQAVLVIQGHPRSWVKQPQRFTEFKKIIDYLLSQNAQFTTPYQYYLSSAKDKN